MGKKHELLIDDGQLLILETRLAVLIGDRQAIALQQLHYWVEINRKAKKETHFFDEKWWVYNTWNEWHNVDFPFWSVRTIRRVFDDLQEMKLVFTRQHEDRNKGLWAAIDYEVLDGLTKASDPSGQNGQTRLDKMDRQSGQNEQTTGTTENTETTTEIVPNGKIPSAIMNPMKDAIFAAFGYADWKALTKSEAGLIQSSAKELIDAGVTPSEVPALYKYCDGKFDNFTAKALPSHLNAWRKTTNGNANGYHNGTKVSAQMQVRIQEYATDRLLTYEEAEKELLEGWNK